MKKIVFTLIAIILALFVYAQNEYYWSGGEKHYLKQQPNVFIVKFNDDDFESIAVKLKEDKNINRVTRIKRNIGIIQAQASKLNVDRLRVHENIQIVMPVFQADMFPIYPTGEILLQPKNNVLIDDIISYSDNNLRIKSYSKYNTYVLETDDWEKLLKYSNLIYESGLVEYCHPNFIAPRVKHQINDPKYVDQYYLNNTGQFGGTIGIDINAPEAWSLISGSCPIKVAVIDDGIEPHEDLSGRVLQGYTPQTSQNNPDTHGYPNTNNPTTTSFPYDADGPFGHGECCAGIIAASHNSLGIRGVAPNVSIVPINIFNDWFVDRLLYYGEYVDFINYAEDEQDCANAIDYAWDDAGADIISNSWGYSVPSAYFDVIEFAIERARTRGRVYGTDTLGCVVVFSSGNSNLNFSGVTFPANVSGVITVGAIDKNGNIWNYSSRGTEMDFVAPSGGSSGDVRTIDREGTNGYVNGNYYDSFNGTSAACPQVSGVVALMLSVNPFLSETEICTILQQTATDMGNSGFDYSYGYGRVNAYSAVVKAVGGPISGSYLICPSGTALTVNNTPPGSTISWSTSSNITRESAQGDNPCTFTPSGSGEGWIKATISTIACGDIVLPTKYVTAGLFNFQLQVSPLRTNDYGEPKACPYTDYVFTLDENGAPCYGYDLSWTVPSTWTINYTTGSTISINTNDDPANYIYVDFKNCCDEDDYASLYFVDGSPCGDYLLVISPNPSNGETTLTIESSSGAESFDENAEWDIEVYGASQNLQEKKPKLKGSTAKLQTAGWKEGVYLVRAVFKDDILTGKLVVKR